MFTHQTGVKTHAIAFIQFVEGQDGQKHREGPWNEGEETRVNEQWNVRSTFFFLKRAGGDDHTAETS
jgi:hypothetical protein